jgi:uncharacterized protein (DUF2225 family)
MGGPTPFVQVEVPCPICGARASNRYIKSKSYEVVASDADGFVRSYRWLNPAFGRIRPDDYFLWHCASCGYVDLQEDFREPEKRKVELENLKERLGRLSETEQGVIRALRERIDYPAEFFSPPTVMNAHLLGLYLHELPEGHRRNVEKLGRLSLRTAWLYRDRNGVSEEMLRAEHRFRTGLQAAWPEIPLDEPSGLRRAATYYRSMYDRFTSQTDLRQEVNVLYLLSELHRRLEDFDGSLEHVRMAVHAATTGRQRLKNGGDDASASAHMADWLTSAIDRISDLRHGVLNDIWGRQREGLARALEEVSARHAREWPALLRERGFHPTAVDRLLQERAARGAGRGGFWGWWRRLWSRMIGEDRP